MTTEEDMNKWLKENGYVKKTEVNKEKGDKLTLIIVISFICLCFILLSIYAIENDAFKSNVTQNVSCPSSICQACPSCNCAACPSCPVNTCYYNFTLPKDIKVSLQNSS